MTTAGRRLIDAANEALSIAKGEADASSYVVHAPPPAVDVKAIRQSMNMTQEAFGLRFGFGVARVRDWEQGRTSPAASDRVLLVTIQQSPKTVLQALAKAGGPSSSVKKMARRPRADVVRKPSCKTRSTKVA